MGLLKTYIVIAQKSIQFQYWFNTTLDFKDTQIKAYHSSKKWLIVPKIGTEQNTNTAKIRTFI